jgi:two-component system cell cycle response regulator CpdR
MLIPGKAFRWANGEPKIGMGPYEQIGPFKRWGGLMARILLAEDDESMRRFLARALENAGHEVAAYGMGDEAHDRLKGDIFDILLTDIVMPEMDGIELARHAAEIDPTLKIMFITGFAAVALSSDQPTPDEAKVLSKPFHLRELVAEVDRMMAAA